MSTSIIPATFYLNDELPFDLADSGLRNAGTLSLTDDGIDLSAKKPIAFVGAFFGIVAGGIAIGLVIAGVIGLQMVGFDLMEIRRGSTLAGVVSLVAGIGTFGVVSDIASRLFGFRVAVHIPWRDVNMPPAAHTLHLSWEGKGATCVIPEAHRQTLQEAMPDVV